MSRKWGLLILGKKGKNIGDGLLSIGKDGDAQFFSDDSNNAKTLATMERVKIDWVAADGIKISGFEYCGIEKNGKKKFTFQEWFLRYI